MHRLYSIPTLYNHIPKRDLENLLISGNRKVSIIRYLFFQTYSIQLGRDARMVLSSSYNHIIVCTPLQILIQQNRLRVFSGMYILALRPFKNNVVK